VLYLSLYGVEIAMGVRSVRSEAHGIVAF